MSIETLHQAIRDFMHGKAKYGFHVFINPDSGTPYTYEELRVIADASNVSGEDGEVQS